MFNVGWLMLDGWILNVKKSTSNHQVVAMNLNTL